MEHTRTLKCKICGKTFETTAPNAAYCSVECAALGRKIARAERNKKAKLSKCKKIHKKNSKSTEKVSHITINGFITSRGRFLWEKWYNELWKDNNGKVSHYDLEQLTAQISELEQSGEIENYYISNIDDYL